MPIQKLTVPELKALTTTAFRADPRYVAFLWSIRVGEGGMAKTKLEGVSKQAIKNRLNKAAEQVGVELHYLRSPNDEVVFELAKRI